MKPILIIGPDNSGKSRLAMEMVGRSKSVSWYYGRSLMKDERDIERQLSLQLDWIYPETKTIVIDDVLTKGIRGVINFFSGRKVKVNILLKGEVLVDTPQLVITSSCSSADLDLSDEERKSVTILETRILPENYLHIRIHEANRIEGIDPFLHPFVPRPL